MRPTSAPAAATLSSAPSEHAQSDSAGDDVGREQQRRGDSGRYGGFTGQAQELPNPVSWNDTGDHPQGRRDDRREGNNCGKVRQLRQSEPFDLVASKGQ